MHLPFTLRARVITDNVIPQKESIENLLNELEKKKWKKEKLSKKYRDLLEDCKLGDTITKLKIAKKEEWPTIIKERMLELYDDEIGKKYLCIYLVGYCRNLEHESSIEDVVREVCLKKGNKYTKLQIKKIVNSAISDGVYLHILNSNGEVTNKTYFNDWSYTSENEILNSVLLSLKRNAESEEDKTWYNSMYNKRYSLEKRIEKESIEIVEPLIKRKKIKQYDKERIVYAIQKHSLTEITIKYLKKRLDSVFRIQYADRNKIMRKLFDLIDNIDALADYTIYRFDIDNFFNSVDAKIIFEKYILSSGLKQYEKNILEEVSNVYRHCYAGLPTSNALVEIAGQVFDENIKVTLKDKGLIFFSRYVDDGLIVLNKKVEKDYLDRVVTETLKKCFNDNVKINEDAEKKAYMIKESKGVFSYLGYEFERTKKGQFIFGIEKKKRLKYEQKINDIINDYKVSSNMEIFRQRLVYSISRIVFYNNENSRYSNLGTWDVIGVCSNYCLLRKFIKSGRIIESTRKFLRSSIVINTNIITRGKLPYFLKGKGKDYYSFEYGILNNKSVVFHPNIGWSQEHLIKQIQKLGFTDTLKKKSYRECVKIYCGLIKLKR
ncbi:reverse transcriptase domain-containing protein [Clostridium omnivorum]|uniref:Reverse transcriptase domain-containing protein n=1 Tax=Clostridium omnivorum TaxID=1604902 RepID=A0ABQ5N489_9CLOT|nr:reverse transcriptase domain-containing protein [Clostridium sp. E14]GLC29990.1 hypothetical protein bsdE14_14000 [Clostridium sp. E14]